MSEYVEAHQERQWKRTVEVVQQYAGLCLASLYHNLVHYDGLDHKESDL